MNPIDHLWRVAIGELRRRPKSPYLISDATLASFGVGRDEFMRAATPDLQMEYSPSRYLIAIWIKQ